MARTGTTGTTLGYVYLLHFLTRIGNPNNARGQAQHYIGWSADAQVRIAQHTNGRKPQPGSGTTAKIMAFVQEQGIGFEVAWVVAGTLHDERRLKKRKNAKQMCPFCGGQPPPTASRTITPPTTTDTDPTTS